MRIIASGMRHCATVRSRRTAIVAATLVAALASSDPRANAALAAQATQTRPGQIPRDLSASQPADTPKATTGVIAGTVLVDTGRPARFARVMLESTWAEGVRTTETDDQGRFLLANLPPASYLLRVSKSGLLDVVFGQKVPGSGRPGTPIELASGQKLDRLALTMPRGSVITGTILDEYGDAAFGASVRVMRYVLSDGARTLVASGSARSDDRGIYRVTGLVPGDYVVSAIDGATAERSGIADGFAPAWHPDMFEAVREMNVQMRGMVTASARDTNTPKLDAYVPAYYPGSSNGAAAAVVQVGVGEEKPGIDMQLRRVPVARVSGRVISPAGTGTVSEVRLGDKDHVTGHQTVRSTKVGPDGTFVFSAVPAGTHTLSVFDGPNDVTFSFTSMSHSTQLEGTMNLVRRHEPPARESESSWATIDITTSGQPIDDVLLTLQRGTTVAGSIAWERAARTQPPKVEIGLALANPASAMFGSEQPIPDPVEIDKDGRFVINGVLPGRYHVRVLLESTGSYVKSAMFAGRDALDFPLEVKPGEDTTGVTVTITDRPTELAGALSDVTGAAAAGFTVIAFASDPQFWTPGSRRIRAVRPSTTGRFRFNDLPPGDYLVAAVTDVEPGQWFLQDFLRQLTAVATSLTLGEGEKRELNLRER